MFSKLGNNKAPQEEGNNKASKAIKEKIMEEEAKQRELEWVIARTMPVASARIGIKDAIGADLSIKQIIRCSLKKQHSERTIQALNSLDSRLKMGMRSRSFNYKAELSAILDAPTPAFDADEVDEMVQEARKQLSPRTSSRRHRKTVAV